MATRTSSRIRRLDDRSNEVQQQLITFQLRSVGFLLPIEAVYKAIVFETQGQPLSAINFEGEILPVINVDPQIFNRTDNPASPQQQVALIVQTLDHGQRITLPIDSAPSLCRVLDSSLVPVPKTYKVNCVEAMTDQTSDQPLRFLLNPALLMPAQRQTPTLALAA